MPTLFSTSLLVSIFGDTPLKVVINSALILLLLYVLWRVALRPLLSLLANIRALFAEKQLGTLEITPPTEVKAHPSHTENLLTILQGQLRKNQIVSLEIVANKHAGIKYLVVAEQSALSSIQKLFASYIPEAKFKKSNNDPGLDESSHIVVVQQTRHFALPLKPHQDLTKTDPAAFITGSLAKLKSGEEVALQVAIKPYVSSKTTRLYNRLTRDGQVLLDNKLRYYLLTYWWLWLPSVLIGVLTKKWQVGVVAAGLLWFASFFSNHKEKRLTQLEEKLFMGVAHKLEQPLFATSIRISVTSPDRSDFLAADLIASLSSLNTVNYQQLLPQSELFGQRSAKYVQKLFRKRLLPVLSFNTSILGADELAMLFHFPHDTANREDLVRSHSRTLPAPLSLKVDTKFDVVIGTNKHHGEDTEIGLTPEQRERHMFIVGGTGSGKTTMLKYQIIQDMKNGKGVAVVDPHGDLAEELLSFVPEKRIKDVIYLNPDDLDHPIGVNLLELPKGLTGNDLLREKDRITEAVVSVMRKIFSEDDSGGHRVEYVLRNAVQTALTLEKPTLFTIFKLLNDNKFTKEVINGLEDENLKIFWRDELGKAGSMQKVKMAAGITSKVGRFLFSASARAMLGQEKSTINFDKILDGKILICNFSKGRLGEDTSTLFGVTVLAKLQLAALKRSEQKYITRKPYYLYLDEFQNFATVSFTQMLSEARKYKVFLTMAEQSTQQQDDQKMVNIILANVGTVVVFRTGSPKDEDLLLPMFRPFLEQGEIANLPAYNFYARISGINEQEPVSGQTIRRAVLIDENYASEVIDYSRGRYGAKQKNK